MAFSSTVLYSKEIAPGLVIENGTWNAASVTTGTITPGTVPAGSFVVGNNYVVAVTGTTDFTAVGASASTPGIHFTATGTGTGTGTAYQGQGAVSFQPRNILAFGFTSDGSHTVEPTTSGVYANQIKITCTSSDTGTYFIIGESV